ncbi:hypothetical protein [Halobacillus sp. A5]|uniref:hypothetical protein n=1 Tax=Halobacillus sp. A5 TaxID=2880263 RepID=UPI0020A670F0|nr:hypothetical protein [Halobacillus sp. A5]MCP3027173.1 hypothetical protein [Halobacillus sp. A5]
MEWKLRIPMIIFVFGIISGIYQLFPSITIFENSYVLRSVQYIGSLAIVIFLLELTGMHEKKISVFFGITLILNGFLFDLFTSLPLTLSSSK